MAKYAYARAGSRDASFAKQLQSFALFGVPKENTFVDEDVGICAAYGRLLEVLKSDDLLVIKSLSALGDDYGSISAEWSRLAVSKGADICVIDMPALDTRKGESREAVSAAVMQVLGFCTEREQRNRALQAKGIEAAKERGVKFGRPATQYSEEFLTAIQQFKTGEITLKQALALTGMKQSNFYYHLHKWEQGAVNRLQDSAHD